MNDRPTNHDSSGDTDVVALLDLAGLEPTDAFRTSLEADLRAEAAGANVTTLRSARVRVRWHRRHVLRADHVDRGRPADRRRTQGSRPACVRTGLGHGVSPVGAVLRELLATRPEVRATPHGLVLTNGTSAFQLRRLEEVEFDPSGVTIAAGAVFGIRPGLGVTIDDVIGAVTPELGEPDLDTGWIDDPSDGQMANCELRDYRELAWGDLVFGFWGTGERTLLLFWHVGDGAVVSNRIPDVERPDAGSTGLRTEVGVGLGDSIDDIPSGFNVNKDPDPNRPPGEIMVIVVSANSEAPPNDPKIHAGSYLVVDGTVVAFGSEDFFC